MQKKWRLLQMLLKASMYILELNMDWILEYECDKREKLQK